MSRDIQEDEEFAEFLLSNGSDKEGDYDDLKGLRDDD